MDDASPEAALRHTLALLARSSFEVTAAQSVERDELAAIPSGSLVSITHLPHDRPAELVAAAHRVAAAGLQPVPHLAARSIASQDDLAGLLDGFSAAGARRVLLIAGDRPLPAGPFADTLTLLATGSLERHRFEVGFAGHPEGAPHASAEGTLAALVDKLARARARGLTPWIATQFSFEAQPILKLLERLAAAGEAAPVRIGLAGPASTATLIKFAIRCGVGASVRALQRGGFGLFGRLVGEGGRTEALVDQLAAALAKDPAPRVEGFHFYSFGGLGRTIAWHRAHMDALRAKAG